MSSFVPRTKDCSKTINFDDDPSERVAGLVESKQGVGSCETKASKGSSITPAVCNRAVLGDCVRQVMVGGASVVAAAGVS